MSDLCLFFGADAIIGYCSSCPASWTNISCARSGRRLVTISRNALSKTSLASWLPEMIYWLCRAFASSMARSRAKESIGATESRASTFSAALRASCSALWLAWRCSLLVHADRAKQTQMMNVGFEIISNKCSFC